MTIIATRCPMCGENCLNKQPEHIAWWKRLMCWPGKAAICESTGDLFIWPAEQIEIETVQDQK